ncbi:hypothetical protein F511_39861 [Dorcoceras hygrometricum]|uniref:Uncharacterized protein n=1 Tax=Dorcoceras hygrometricum TaxID=472368 RepID=A0A2Z7CYG5_9LAMI|nr:hypothetical protein F511_39861 [Dorcoceras hygrometricum]
MSCWSIVELTAGALACTDERSVLVVLNAGEGGAELILFSSFDSTRLELWISVVEEARNSWRCDAFREI